MVTQVASTSDAKVEYSVRVEHGVAVSCTCIGHSYGHTCKHMKSVNADIKSEIAKAERFLAVRQQVQGMEENWRAYRDMAWDNRF